MNSQTSRQHSSARDCIVFIVILVVIALIAAGANRPGHLPENYPRSSESASLEGEGGNEEAALVLGDTIAQALMAFTSVLATAISIWAVKLLSDTLRETRAAVKQAAEANNSAEKAIAVSRELGEVQARAYVHVQEAHSDWEDGQGILALDCHNTGQTPAVCVRITAYIRTRTPGMPANNPPIEEGHEYRDFSALGGNSACLLYFPLPSLASTVLDLKKTYQNPDHRLIFFEGRIYYEDVWGTEYQTDFSFCSEDIQAYKSRKLERTAGKIAAYQRVGLT